tara:strand:+ start:5863 stop:6780 length:918 start_codon:yes stop_codon:yes gene_type:complete
MQLILLRDGFSKKHVINVTQKTMLLLLLFIFVITFCLYFGFNQTIKKNSQLNTSDTNSLYSLANIVNYEKIYLDELIEESNIKLDSMSEKLGTLTAHLARLDTLGQHLVDTANLDKDVFNFGKLDDEEGGTLHLVEDKKTIDIFNTIDKIELLLQEKEKQLVTLKNFFANNKLKKQTQISAKPVENSRISSYFGYRKDPLHRKLALHKGVDFAAKPGSNVAAVASGIVTYSGVFGSYGNFIEIDHGNNYKTRYAHNKSLHVAKGDSVTKGQIIAALGNTGRSTGPHLHFEVLKDDKHINPIKFLG